MYHICQIYIPIHLSFWIKFHTMLHSSCRISPIDIIITYIKFVLKNRCYWLVEMRRWSYIVPSTFLSIFRGSLFDLYLSPLIAIVIRLTIDRISKRQDLCVYYRQISFAFLKFSASKDPNLVAIGEEDMLPSCLSHVRFTFKL